jgi:hypothetical protein
MVYYLDAIALGIDRTNDAQEFCDTHPDHFFWIIRGSPRTTAW